MGDDLRIESPVARGPADAGAVGEHGENPQAPPPMPWFNLNAMTAEDLGAMYQFLRYLGPAGTPAPAYVPPDQEPAGPYATFPAPPK